MSYDGKIDCQPKAFLSISVDKIACHGTTYRQADIGTKLFYSYYVQRKKAQKKELFDYKFL